MQKFKVIALNVTGLSGRLFYAQEIVNEDAFPEGHAQAYVESGHMEVYNGEVAKEVAAETIATPSAGKPANKAK